MEYPDNIITGYQVLLRFRVVQAWCCICGGGVGGHVGSVLLAYKIITKVPKVICIRTYVRISSNRGVSGD